MEQMHTPSLSSSTLSHLCSNQIIQCKSKEDLISSSIVIMVTVNRFNAVNATLSCLLEPQKQANVANIRHYQYQSNQNQLNYEFCSGFGRFGHSRILWGQLTLLFFLFMSFAGFLGLAKHFYTRSC